MHTNTNTKLKIYSMPDEFVDFFLFSTTLQNPQPRGFYSRYSRYAGYKKKKEIE